MDRSLTRWRWGVALVLLLLGGTPVLAPLAELLRRPQSLTAVGEVGRLLELAWNSARLAGLTLIIGLGLGVPAAVLLFRTDLPGRTLWRTIVVASLFVPLPLVTSAWQMAAASLGWPAGGGSWLQGIIPAAWVHAMAVLPWVILLVGLGLIWVEPELEEDALLLMPPLAVLWKVTLPRAGPSILLAGAWTVLFTLGEIIVTDRMQVRTFAEEVYNQFVATDSLNEVARAVAVALPPVLLLAALAYLILRQWRERLPARQELLRSARTFPLSLSPQPLSLKVAVDLRRPCLIAVLLGVLLLIGVPLWGLVWKAGLRYAAADNPGPPMWEASLVLERVVGAFQRQAGLLLQTLVLAGLTGVIAGFLALVACWLSRGNRRFERYVGLLATALWAFPGPILGIGVLETEQFLFDLPGGDLARFLLWDGPSLAPNLWVCVLRFFPLAFAMLWPLLRTMPAALEELARLDGLGPLRRLTWVILPAMRGPLLVAMLGVAILSLGELSAGKLVSTPGYTTLAQHIFAQMHYGADTELAALCLLLLIVVTIPGAVFAGLTGHIARRQRLSW